MPSLLTKPKLDFETFTPFAKNLALLLDLRLVTKAHNLEYADLHNDAGRWHLSMSCCRNNGKLSVSMNWPMNTAAGFQIDHNEAHCSVAISDAKPVNTIAKEILTRLINPCGPILRKIHEHHDQFDQGMARLKAIMAPIAALFPDGTVSDPLSRPVELRVRRKSYGINDAEFEVGHRCLDYGVKPWVYEPFVKLELECLPDLAKKIAELIALQTRPDAG